MDAVGPMDTRHIPRGMHPDRAYRWCVARTTRDLRLSVRSGRTISLPSLRRLFTRRWLNVLRQCRPAANDRIRALAIRHGQSAIRQMYMSRQPIQAFVATSSRR